MHDCCIRATALLECFEWTWNKPHNNRTRGVVSTMLSKPSGWGSTFGAISFYYDLIFKGRVPSHSIIIVIKRGVVTVLVHLRLMSREPCMV